MVSVHPKIFFSRGLQQYKDSLKNLEEDFVRLMIGGEEVEMSQINNFFRRRDRLRTWIARYQWALNVFDPPKTHIEDKEYIHPDCPLPDYRDKK